VTSGTASHRPAFVEPRIALAFRSPVAATTTTAYASWVTSTAKKILDEALALPDDERAALMEALSDSFDPEPAQLSPEWKAEVQSRIAQVERGEVETVPWEQVEARIRQTLDRK